jgi:hypothetical protein
VRKAEGHFRAGGLGRGQYDLGRRGSILIGKWDSLGLTAKV